MSPMSLLHPLEGPIGCSSATWVKPAVFRSQIDGLCTGRDVACLPDLAVATQGAVSAASIIRRRGALFVSGVHDAQSHLETCCRAAFGSAITYQMLQVQERNNLLFSSFHPVAAFRNNSMIDVSSHSFRRGSPHLHICPQTIPCNIRAANLFDCRRVSQVFDLLSITNLYFSKRQNPLASSLIGWPISIWNADYDDIRHHNGLDAYFFVRFLRMMFRIFIPIWLVSWAVLLPIHAAGRTNGLKGLDQLTFGNVAQHERYSAHVILIYFFTGNVSLCVCMNYPD